MSAEVAGKPPYDQCFHPHTLATVDKCWTNKQAITGITKSVLSEMVGLAQHRTYMTCCLKHIPLLNRWKNKGRLASNRNQRSSVHYCLLDCFPFPVFPYLWLWQITKKTGLGGQTTQINSTATLSETSANNCKRKETGGTRTHSLVAVFIWAPLVDCFCLACGRKIYSWWLLW